MTRRGRRWLTAIVVVVVVLGGAYFAGLRLFVLTPREVAGGATLLLMGAGDLAPVDSSAGYCVRHGSGADPACRSAINVTIGQSAILARFGFADWLYRLSGAPAETA
jgi:hypothetical protein